MPTHRAATTYPDSQPLPDSANQEKPKIHLKGVADQPAIDRKISLGTSLHWKVPVGSKRLISSGSLQLQ
jgi:hypothetical protein